MDAFVLGDFTCVAGGIMNGGASSFLLTKWAGFTSNPLPMRVLGDVRKLVNDCELAGGKIRYKGMRQYSPVSENRSMPGGACGRSAR